MIKASPAAPNMMGKKLLRKR